MCNCITTSRTQQQKLYLRGYMGVSLLGQTATFHRYYSIFYTDIVDLLALPKSIIARQGR
ncbi:DUF2147 domain-containing protein [Chitinophaga eiseniae]|uniref:DUF2147 domain-containing protein n=1 Tax=Chitinophaga eiseniae TaxID=634771 RepID=A0A847SDJ8_9BACT|nr:DUF2147 domain-containing protein [Chitinophaga eiseniae]